MSFEKKDLLEIAQTLIDQKFHDQADKLLFDISQNFGIDPEISFLSGLNQYENGNPSLAKNYLENALMLAQTIDPNSALSAKVEKQILQIEEKEKDREKNEKRKLREAVEMSQPRPQEEHQRHSKPQINKSTTNSNKNSAKILVETDRSEHELGYETRHVFHPYFGFIQRPGKAGDLNNNNYGFAFKNAPVHYPTEDRDANPFYIGVFGGSVPGQMVTSHGHFMEAEISKICVTSGRPIQILQFCQGGWEQPQSLIALCYFLSIGQRFDMVINIDGFNETAGKRLQYEHGLHPAMPNISIIGPLRRSFQSMNLNPGLKEKAAGILHMQAKIARLGNSNNVFNSWRKKSAERKLNTLERASLGEDIGKKNDLIALHTREKFDPELIENDPEAREMTVNEIVRLWERSSRLMNQLCNTDKIPYLHVLVPNQYDTKKPMKENERAIAIDPGSFLVNAVPETFNLMRESGQRLAKAGVDFIDLSDCFDTEPECCFSDKVCHLNTHGKQIFADRLIIEIERILSS